MLSKILGRISQPLAFSKNGNVLISKLAHTMASVSFSSENKQGECPGCMVKAGPVGVVVLQEWWGMNEQIKEEAKDISQRGNFTVLVPDLYRGKVATDHETAGHYMNDLDWQGAVCDIRGAAKYLKANGCSKVGVVGFCMGGALTLAAAALVEEVNAAAPFYGIPSAELCDVSKIKVPVQCHFGEEDKLEGFSSPKDYEALRKKMTDGGVPFELHTYKAGHAFTNKTGPLGNYKEEVAELALNRMVDFFKAKLG